jgi:uncharacterized protein
MLRILIYYFITVVLTLILGIGQEQLKINYEKIAIPQFAPAISVFIITSLFPTLKIHLNVKFEKRIYFSLLLATLIPFCLLSIGYYFYHLLGLKFELTNDLMTTLPIVLGGMIFGAIGEEIGWRGFLQPNIERKYVMIPSAIIVGLFWGLWHIGNYQNGIVFMIGFLLFTISASLILRILLDQTENNLMVSIFFHLSINSGFFVFFKNSLTNEKMICGNGIIWTLTALALSVIWNRKNKQLILQKK